MLNLEAFQPFLELTENAELIANNKFAVVVKKDNSWEITEISESDFEKYELWAPTLVEGINVNDESHPDYSINELAKTMGGPAYPLVKLV